MKNNLVRNSRRWKDIDEIGISDENYDGGFIKK